MTDATAGQPPAAPEPSPSIEALIAGIEQAGVAVDDDAAIAWLHAVAEAAATPDEFAIAGQLTADPTATEPAVMQDAGGKPAQGRDAFGVYRVYAFTRTLDAGAPAGEAAYVACRPLVPGESVLGVVHFAPLADYEAEAAARAALLATLVLPQPPDGEDGTSDP